MQRYGCEGRLAGSGGVLSPIKPLRSQMDRQSHARLGFWLGHL